MSGSLVAVLDACVLYPAPLRDLLLQLAATDLFRAKWTDQIHDEWIRNVLKDRSDLIREQLERTRILMDANTLDCLVENYEEIIPSLTLPDPNDRHVLAAAIHCEASKIITFNLRDFPEFILSKYDIDAQHPDDFIILLLELDINTVLDAINIIRARLRKPPRSLNEYLLTLAEHGLPQTVDMVKSYVHMPIVDLV